MGKAKRPTPALMSAYFAEIGRRGGQKSKRTLTKAQAKAMNEAKRRKREGERAKPKRVPRRPREP